MKQRHVAPALAAVVAFVLFVPLLAGGPTGGTGVDAAGARGSDLPTPSYATTHPWPMQRFNVTHSGHTTSPSPDTNALLWSNSTGSPALSSPAIADGKVFIGAGTYMHAFHQNNGTRVWRTPLDSAVSGGLGLTSSPAYANGMLFYGGDRIYGVYANNGTIKWRVNPGNLNWGDGTPTVANGMVFIGGSDRRLYAIDQGTGQVAWTFQTLSTPSNNYGLYSAPAVSGNYVYLAACDGYVYQINITQPGSVATAYHRSALGSTMYGSPVVYNGMVLVGNGYYSPISTANRFRALRASDLGPVWEFYPGSATSFFGSAAVAYDTVYVGSVEGNLYALNAQTGAERWRASIGTTWSSPAVSDGKLFIGAKNGNVYSFNANQSGTPTPRWTYSTGGEVDSSPSISDGLACFGSGSANVYCLGTLLPPPVDNPPTVSAWEPGGAPGQTYTIGQTVQVRWTATDERPMPANNVNVSFGGGASWTYIIRNTGNDGVHPWDTTGLPAGMYSINVTAYDSRGQATWDLGNNTFQLVAAPDEPPVVSAWEPGGTSGQTYTAGQIVQVRWLATDDRPMPANNVNVSYGSGASWITIAQNLPNTGSLGWDTTGGSPGTYSINVSAYDSRGQASSDVGNYTFQLVPPANAQPTAAIAQPAGGEVWSGGAVVGIAWDMNDAETAPANLIVWLNYTSAIGGGSIAGPLTGLLPPFGIPWTLPPIDATDVVVTIDVVDAGGGRGSDASNPFEIDSTRPRIASARPRDGETGVATNANVQVDWSEGMDQASAAAAFALYDNLTWTSVGGQVGWVGNSFFFNPTVDLPQDSWFTANVTTLAMDDSSPGNHLLALRSWSFRTAALPDTSAPTVVDATALPDPQEVHLRVNVSAVVADDFAVGLVTANVSGPSGVSNRTMLFDASSGRYYSEQAHDRLGPHAFRIWACDTSGNCNSATGSFTIRDSTPPLIQHAPPGPAFVGDPIRITATVTDNYLLQDVRLNFTDIEGAVRNASMTSAGSDSYFLDVAAQPRGGTIEYFLWAVDSTGNGARSLAESVAVIALRPNPPTNLSVVPEGYGALRLTWAAPTTDEGGYPLVDLAGFLIYRMVEPGGPGTLLTTAGPISETTYLDTGLADDTTYYYNVTAVNAGGTRSAPTDGSGRTLARTPPASTDWILVAAVAAVIAVAVVLILLFAWRRKKRGHRDGAGDVGAVERRDPR